VNCLRLNFPPFFCPQNRSVLFVGRASTFYHLPPRQIFIAFCLLVDGKSGVNSEKIHSFKVQVHKRKGHLKLLCS